MTKRDDIARRIANLKEKARLLKVVVEGGGGFGDVEDADGNVEIIIRGKNTGHRVSLALANKIRGVEGAEIPRPKIAIQNLYELTPEMLENDFQPFAKYVEEMACCYLIYNDCAPQEMELNVQRVGVDTLKHWFSKREVPMPDAQAVVVE